MADPDDTFEPFMAIPPYLCQFPPLADELSTSTSQLQVQTIDECLPLLNAINDPSSNPFDFDESGLPNLKRSLHIDFLHDGLQQLPAAFVAMDASRPWLMYWSLLSLYLLGQDVKPFRQRYGKSYYSRYTQTNTGLELTFTQNNKDFYALTKSFRGFRWWPGSQFSFGRYVRGYACCSYGWRR